MQDGPADRAAKLRLRKRAGRKVFVAVCPGVGVQPEVLLIAVRRAVKMIRSGLQNAEHTRAVHIARIDRRVRRHHFHFFQGLGRGAIGDQVVERLVHINAVQRVVV